MQLKFQSEKLKVGRLKHLWEDIIKIDLTVNMV